VKDVKYVLVWGTSARHYPQHCGLGHVLQDEDVVQIVKKKVHKLSLAYSDLKVFLLENSTRLPYHYPWTRKNFFKRVVANISSIVFGPSLFLYSPTHPKQ
jgi:hypothetical protein